MMVGSPAANAETQNLLAQQVSVFCSPWPVGEGDKTLDPLHLERVSSLNSVVSLKSDSPFSGVVKLLIT